MDCKTRSKILIGMSSLSQRLVTINNDAYRMARELRTISSTRTCKAVREMLNVGKELSDKLRNVMEDVDWSTCDKNCDNCDK